MADPQLVSRPAEIVSHDVKARRLVVRLFRWDDARTVSDGGRPYREKWARGSLVPEDRLYVMDRHGGNLIGRMDPPTDGGDGPVAAVYIAPTTAGSDLLALVDSGVVDSVSIEFRPDPSGEIWNRDRSEVTRTRALLGGIAFAFTPAHDSAILARMRQLAAQPDAQRQELAALRAELEEQKKARSSAPPERKSPMDLKAAVEERLERGRTALTEAFRSTDPAVSLAHADLALRSVEQLGALRRLDPYLGNALQQLADAQRTDKEADERKELHRALADITTADVPGLMATDSVAPSGLTSFDPAIAAPFVTRYGQPTPERGFTFSAPKWMVPTAGQQLVEKGEVTSGVLTIGRETIDLKTFAYGNDMANPVPARSNEMYAELLIDLMYAGVNKVVEDYALDQMIAGITPAATTRATLVDDVLAAMGTLSAFVGLGPANVVAAGSDVGPVLAYELGKSEALGMPQVVTTLGLAPDLVLVAHRLAFVVLTTPLELMRSPVPAELGLDVAAFRGVAAGRILDGASAIVLQLGTV